MSVPHQPDIRDFFARFEQAGNDLDAEALRDLFCDVFLNLDPVSAAPVPREAMLNALPMRAKLFGAIGAQGADLLELTETRLDERHVLVETSWQTRFGESAPSREPLILRSMFLLRLDGGQWRIAVYLNHQDIVQTIEQRAAAQG